MQRILTTLVLATIFVAPPQATDWPGKISDIRIDALRDGTGFRVAATARTEPGEATDGAALAVVFGPKGSQHNVQLRDWVASRYTYTFWIKPQGGNKGWGKTLHKGNISVRSADGKLLGETVALALSGDQRVHHNWIGTDGVAYAASLRVTSAEKPDSKASGWLKGEWIVRTSRSGSSKETLGFDWGTSVSLELADDKLGVIGSATATADGHRTEVYTDVPGDNKAAGLGVLKVGQFASVVAVALDADGQPASKPRLLTALVGEQNGGDAFGDATNAHLALPRLPDVEKKGRGVYRYGASITSSSGGVATATVVFVHETADDGVGRDVLVLGDVVGKLGELAGAELTTHVPGTKTVITFKLGETTKLKGGGGNIGIPTNTSPIVIQSWGVVLD